MGGRGRKQACGEVELRRIVGCDPGREDGAEEEGGEHQEASEGEALVGGVAKDGIESRGPIERIFHASARLPRKFVTR